MKKIIKLRSDGMRSFNLTKIKINLEKEANLNSSNTNDEEKLNRLINSQDKINILYKKDMVINPYYIDLGPNKEDENIEDTYEVEKGIIKKKLSFSQNSNKYHFGKQRFSRNLNNNLYEKIDLKNSDQINNNNEISSFNKNQKQLSFIQKKKVYKLFPGRNLSKDIIKIPNQKFSVSNYQSKKKFGKVTNLYSNLNLFPNIKNDNFSNSTKENKSVILKNIHNKDQKYKIRKKNKTPKYQSSNSNSLYSVSTMPYKISNNDSCSDGSKLYIKLKTLLNRNQKYHFVYNPNTVFEDENDDLLPEVKKFNSRCLVLLKKENSKLFNQYFSVIQECKFSNKFRDPLNNPMDKDLKEKEKAKKLNSKNATNDNIFPSGKELFELLDKEIIKERKSMNKNKFKKLSKNAFNQKLKKLIIKNCIYIKKHLSLTLKEILLNSKFSGVALSCSKTEQLINAIKNKNYELCCYIIDKYKNSVLDFDYFHMTPLHYAAKNNFYQIIPKIAEYGGSVDFQNFLGDTALHICTRKLYYESMVILLLYVASPFIKNNKGKRAIQCSNDFRVGFLLKKIEMIHLKNFFTKSNLFYESIQKEFLDFILKEFNNQIEPDALSIFQSKAFIIL